MKNPHLLLTAIVCLLAYNSFSQPICGFDIIHQREMNLNPAYRRNVLENEKQIQRIIQEQDISRSLSTEGANPPASPLATLYTIPVVVHVVNTGGAVGTIYNPDDTRIINTLNYLNACYNGTYPGTTPGAGDIQVQFQLATRGPNCQATTGIDRVDGSFLAGYVANGVKANTAGVADADLKYAVGWNPRLYYNVYVVNKIDGADGTVGQFIAGYALFPGASPVMDGIVMLATQMNVGAKTLPHEIGHALQLYHPFQGSNDVTQCPPNADCNVDGDKVCDTDPISYNQSGGVVNFTPRTGTNSCNGLPYTDNTERNFMNYTNTGAAGYLFTNGQKTRMLAAMNLYDRVALPVSPAFYTSYPLPTFTPPVAACPSVTSSTGLGGGFAGLLKVSVDNKTFGSGPTPVDTGYLNNANKCLYLMPLVVNGNYVLTTTMLGVNNEQIRAWIDYNNDGVFDNATEQLVHNTNIGILTNSYNSLSTPFTVPAGATQNTILRMRIIEEISTVYGAGYNITGACYNPTYGQAEDYPVIITAAPLPVLLEYFKGSPLNKSVRLSWKTAFEQNADVFEIERSNDGTHFSRIGSVPATDNSNGSAYQYDDAGYTGSILYYRLKQIDKDGRPTYSNVITIKLPDQDESIVSTPNPFYDQLTVRVRTTDRTSVRVDLVDVTGQLIYSKQASVLNGSLVVPVPNTTQLSAGIYFLRVTMNGKTITKKLVKEQRP